MTPISEYRKVTRLHMASLQRDLDTARARAEKAEQQARDIDRELGRAQRRLQEVEAKLLSLGVSH